jgi:hypothetical protein
VLRCVDPYGQLRFSKVKRAKRVTKSADLKAIHKLFQAGAIDDEEYDELKSQITGLRGDEDTNQSQPHYPDQSYGNSELRIPGGSGSVTNLPVMSLGWSPRWRYPWMPNNFVAVLFWMVFYWIAVVWVIAWIVFQVAKPRPGSNRYLAFDAVARRRYTVGCTVAGATGVLLLFFAL